MFGISPALRMVCRGLAFVLSSGWYVVVWNMSFPQDDFLRFGICPTLRMVCWYLFCSWWYCWVLVFVICSRWYSWHFYMSSSKLYIWHGVWLANDGMLAIVLSHALDIMFGFVIYYSLDGMLLYKSVLSYLHTMRLYVRFFLSVLIKMDSWVL